MTRRKTGSELAEAAAELYANRDDLAGETVELAPSRNLKTVVSVRLSEEDLAAVEAAAQARGVTLSKFIREAALAVASEPDAVVTLDHVRLALSRLRADVLTKLTADVDEAVKATRQDLSIPA